MDSRVVASRRRKPSGALLNAFADGGQASAQKTFRRQDATTYAMFILVGTSCGWLLNNALMNLIANEKRNFPRQGEEMAGKFANIQGWVSMGSGIVYSGCLFANPRGLSLRGEQLGIACLIVLTILGFFVLSVAWDYGSPEYPCLSLASVLGNVVGNLTYYVLFPCISSHYSSWLIAPVRAGSDFSSLLLALLSNVQFVDGKSVSIPEWAFFAGLACLGTSGLWAWCNIMRDDIGKTSHDDDATNSILFHEMDVVNETAIARFVEVSGDDGPNEASTSRLRFSWIGLACPRSLVIPVFLGTISQVCQWTFAASLGVVASSMTDPTACGGDVGARTNHISQSISFVLLPLASVLSSLASCPRWLFKLLTLCQIISTLVVVLVSLGAWRHFWVTRGGRNVFIGAYSLVAALEGYLLTMAYRYISEEPLISSSLKQSSCRLLSLTGVLVVSPLTIGISTLQVDGVLACSEPVRH